MRRASCVDCAVRPGGVVEQFSYFEFSSSEIIETFSNFPGEIEFWKLDTLGLKCVLVLAGAVWLGGVEHCVFGVTLYIVVCSVPP